MKQYTRKEIQHIKNTYGKISSADIANNLNRTVEAIYLKANKLKLKSSIKRKYKVNDKFFNRTTINNSYWAGFIAADGCIKDNNKRIQLKLKSSDIEHLKKFKNNIEFTGKISIYDNGDNSGRKHCFMCITSEKICADLHRNFNITNRKAKTLKPPYSLTAKKSLAFIKGLLDGDGCVRKNKNALYLDFNGTKEVIMWIKDVLNNILNINCNSKVRYTGTCYRFTISHRKAVKVFKYLNSLKTDELCRKWSIK